MRTVTYALPINPEPWVVGNAYVGRGGGKAFAKIAPDKTLQLYQNAVRAELEAQGAEPVPGKYMLELYFFRQNAQYLDTAGRKRTRNTPDVTNMQKATEDALQGVLIDNDRNVVDVSSHLIAAGTDVDPMVVIHLTYGLELSIHKIPRVIMESIQKLKDRRDKIAKKAADDNVWTP